MNAKNTYEGMFLLDAGESDVEAAMEPIRKVLDRSEAEVLSMKPWDERRLAYTLKGRKRGLYVLSYFKLDPSRIREVEHDCGLEERILRSLILRPRHLTAEQIDGDTPATASARKAAAREQARAERLAAEAAAAAAEPAAGDEAPKPGAEVPAPEPVDEATAEAVAAAALAEAPEPAPAPAEEPAAPAEAAPAPTEEPAPEAASDEEPAPPAEPAAGDEGEPKAK